MKDYNFMISDNRLHKTRFYEKMGGEGSNQNCPHKEGGSSKGKGGGLERFHILRGVGQKEGVTIRKVGVLD